MYILYAYDKYIICIYKYIYDCVYVCMSKVIVKVKRDLNPQELELQVVLSQPWVLKIEI